MKNEEKIYLAIGEIDESLISEANEGRGRRKFPIRKISVIAASIVLSIAVGFIGLAVFAGLASTKGDMNNAPEYGGSDNSASAPDMWEDEMPSDTVYESDIGRLTILGRDGNSFNFLLEITTNTDLPIHVNSYDKLGNNIASTNSNNNAISTPIITVDGVQAYVLPGQVGSYNVTITFPDVTDTPEAAPDEDLPDSPGEGLHPDGFPDSGTSGDIDNSQSLQAVIFIIDNFGPVRFKDFADGNTEGN